MEWTYLSLWKGYRRSAHHILCQFTSNPWESYRMEVKYFRFTTSNHSHEMDHYFFPTKRCKDSQFAIKFIATDRYVMWKPLSWVFSNQKGLHYFKGCKNKVIYMWLESIYVILTERFQKGKKYCSPTNVFASFSFGPTINFEAVFHDPYMNERLLQW